MTVHRPDHDALLAQMGWLRALARSLVSEWDVADDLVQDTWVAALRGAPSNGSALRAWLARVVENVLRQRLRRDHARIGREQASARSETAPGPEVLAEQIELHRTLVDAVLELEEPYRSTIVLRYYNGLSLRGIARRFQLPLSTVNSRHTRGMRRLRTLVQKRMGRQRAWLAILPLAAPRSSLTATAAGALFMSTQAKIAIGVLVLACSVFVFLGLSGEPITESPGPTSRPGAETHIPDLEPRQPTGLAAVDYAGERKPLGAAPTLEGATEVEEASSEVIIRGRVLDVLGTPRPGISVRFHHGGDESYEGPSAETLADGRFEMNSTGRTGVLVTRTPGWTTVLASDVQRATLGSEHILIIAPLQPLAGIVVDESDSPLQDVAVWVELPSDLRSRFEMVMDRSMPIGWRSRTDTSGRFDLPQAPGMEDALLVAEAAGYEPFAELRPPMTDRTVRIVLHPEGLAVGELAGRVVDLNGEPVPHSLLRLGKNRATCDDNGEFRIATPEEPLGDSTTAAPPNLLVVHEGFVPSVIPPPLNAKGLSEWPEYLVVELDGPPPSINGIVLDTAGEPRSGIMVWVGNPMEFDRRREQGSHFVPLLVEDLVAGEPGEYFRPVFTNDAGQFTIESLMQRPYRVFAMDPEGLVRTERAGVVPGEEHVELRMPEDAVHERVAGRVLSRGGSPVEGVTVTLDTFTVRTSVLLATAGGRGSSVTDEDGRFELENVPRRFVHLHIDGDDIVPSRLAGEEGSSLEDLGDVESLEVVVSARCHFRVQISGGDRGEAFQILDEREQPLRVSRFFGGTRTHATLVELGPELRSDVMVVAEDAQVIRILREGEEVRREPMRLVPGEVNIVYL